MTTLAVLAVVIAGYAHAPARAEETRTYPGGGAQDMLNMTKNPFEEADRKKATSGTRFSGTCTTPKGKVVRAEDAGYDECVRSRGATTRPGETGSTQGLTIGSGGN